MIPCRTCLSLPDTSLGVMALSSIHVVTHGTSDGLYGRVGGCKPPSLQAVALIQCVCVLRAAPAPAAEGGPQVLGCVTSAASPAEKVPGKAAGGGVGASAE